MADKGYCSTPYACIDEQLRENECKGCFFNHVEAAERWAEQLRAMYPRRCSSDSTGV